MTSSPPLEATYFRGKTLTPESPVPIHIPEASSIPVLQHQTDPTFNLTSTHVRQVNMPSNTSAIESSAIGQSLGASEPGTGLLGLDVGKANFANFQQNSEMDGEGDDASAISYENEEVENQEGLQEADSLQSHTTSTTIHPSAPLTAHEPSLTIPTDDTSSTLPTILSQTFPGQIHEQAAETQKPFQGSPLINGQTSADDEVTHQGNAPTQIPEQGVSEGGVNYDALLDSLSPSTSTAPSAENLASITTAAPSDASNVPRPSSADQPISALPVPAGLPPRPPPQEKPAIHPNYNAENDISTYHFPQTQTSANQTSHPSPSSNSYRPPQGYAPPTPKAVGANGLPPPPLATFQQSSSQAGQAQPSPLTPQARQGHDTKEPNSARATEENDDEIPYTPEIEAQWSEFLREEAVYVNEGLWDRFPPGSRLFVGNLFTEKATKRDLFYVFHKYGRLAQISIKNAYGFVQYHDASCCQRALQAEQGVPVRGRKLHLEVSKPQKNTRNAAPTAAGDSLRAGYNRRSRSPDYGRGSQRGSQRGTSDRLDRGVPPGGLRGELRRRDDYRPLRSPSPRGYRSRDEYRGSRGRSPDRYYGGRRSRSRSPYGRNGRYRSRSPLGRDMDEESSLPFPRRDIRDVPDVQLILVDQVDRTFVGYIEKTFRERGLRCDVLQLPRVSLDAVIKRQMIEGVQAVVKILRQSQVTGKIPLQVFDRRGGHDNIRFDEYEGLDAGVAAELVVRAKSTHMAPRPSQSVPTPAYGAPQYGQYAQQVPPSQQPTQQPQQAGVPNLANLITSLDGPALQKLLGAMSQNPQTPQTPQNSYQQPQQQPDLAALLGNAGRQPPVQQGYTYGTQQQQPAQPQQPQQYNAQAVNHAFANNPALASLLSNANNRGPQPMQQQQQQYQPGQQQNVQNIMDHLNRWKQ